MITKEDWKQALKQHEDLLINSMVNIEAHKFMVKLCDEKIAEFPEEKDDMPDDVKKVIKEANK